MTSSTCHYQRAVPKFRSLFYAPREFRMILVTVYLSLSIRS